MNQRMLEDLLIQFHELEHDRDELNDLPAEAYDVLLKEIVAFKSLKPWQWMDETQPFNVFITDLNKEFICTILGHHDDLVGFVMYEGEESYRHYCNEKNKAHLDYPLFKLKEQLRQPRYQITFTDKECLSSDDHNVLEVNQRRFRGAKQWPKIRYVAKGCQPRRLKSRMELELLTACLTQANRVAKQIKNNRLTIPAQRRDRLTYVTAYKDELVMNKDSYLKGVERIEKRLNRTQKQKLLPYQTMEQEAYELMLSQFYLSHYIETKQDKRHPFITFVQCEAVSYHEMYVDKQEEAVDIWDFILPFFECVKSRPKSILVDDLALINVLSQGCEWLGITVKLQEPLRLDETKGTTRQSDALDYPHVIIRLHNEIKAAFDDFNQTQSVKSLAMRQEECC